MKKVGMVVLACFLNGALWAQSSTGTSAVEHEYERSLGLKMFPGAISYKWKWDAESKAEALLYMSSDGFRLTGLYEKYFPLTPEVPGLNWFIGGGAHWGIWSDDWQPSFNIIGYQYFEGGWGGIGIRYVLR